MSTLQTQYQNFLKDFPTSNLTYYEWMDIKFSKIPEEINDLINELKNKDYFTILKFCENRDLEGLDELFNELFFKAELDTLNIIDKFYLLLAVRMLFIDPDITFNDSIGSAVKFNINNILEKIDILEKDLDLEVCEGDFTLKLGLPDKLYFKSLNDIYSSVIKTIKYNGNTIIFSNLNDIEREDVLAYLPNTLFLPINSYITRISNELQNFVIIEKNDQFNIEEINTNIISNEFMGFIMSLFTTGLKNFLELIYIFGNRLNIDTNSFFNLTPLDSKVLVNIYNKDIEEQNKELKNKRAE
jgi:hypothetical protein